MDGEAKARVIELLEGSVVKALASLDDANSLKRQNSPPEGYSPELRQIFAAYEKASTELIDEISDVIHELDVPEENEEDPGMVQGGKRDKGRRFKRKSRKTRRTKRKN
jgi:hypothetical protein